MSRVFSATLLESGDVSQVDSKLAALLQRLGIDAFPAHETRLIALDRLVVPGADLVRPSPKLVRSIAKVGVLQSPAVVLRSGLSLADPEATFEVIFGRRRVLAAHLAGLSVLKCEAYESGTPQLASLLALMENEQRSAAWIKEVQDLHRLMSEKVGMTLDELVEFGFDRGSLTERLKIAQLPLPLLTAIFAGKVSLAVAKKLARLSPSQQEKVANLAVQGEDLTAELVKEALRVQVNAGLAPLQTALALSMTSNGEGKVAPTTLPVPASPVSEAFPVASGAAPSFVGILSTLRTFEQSLLVSPATQTLRVLTHSLIQEVEVAARASTVMFKTTSEGEEHHA
jgi:ParB-like chromosome segregation protein Spo0J